MATTLDHDLEELVEAIAARTGQPMAEVIRETLQARAAQLGVPTSLPPALTAEERYRRTLAIAKRCAERPLLDPRTPDEIVGYNELGLPS